jgi:DNA polymerase III subunit delta'
VSETTPDSGLPPLHGHENARDALATAWKRGRLPRTLLLHGRPGIGKQRLAHWIGQLVVCTEPGSEGPCGHCRECRLARRIEHSGIHWYMPLERPRSRGSRDRNAEALEDARIQWIEEARRTPYRPRRHDIVRGLHLGTVRNLRKSAMKGAGPGGKQLFILADAEELVAQEASQEAANALLKILEEPPEGTWFVLTSSEPGRLLDTIRSRSTALHLTGLDESRLEQVLTDEVGAPAEEAARAARLAEGSLGRALGLLSDDGDPGPLEAIRQDAFHLLRAALQPEPGARFLRALTYSPSGARTLTELFSALEIWLRDLGAAASGHRDSILNADAADWLMKQPDRLPLDPAGPARAVAAVQKAREEAAGNVNPQLLLTGLMRALNGALLHSRS